MAKNLRKPKIGVKNPAAAALLLSFGCGVGVCILLLALAAFLLTHTGLPLSAVRPMACMAAAVGAAVSAAVLARRLQKRLLLCGLGCGAFYAVCLLAATLLANGRLDWQGSNAMLPLALLLVKGNRSVCARRDLSRGAALAVTACTLLTLLQGYSLYASWQPVS